MGKVVRHGGRTRGSRGNTLSGSNRLLRGEHVDEMVAFKLPRADLVRLHKLAVRRTWEEQRRVSNSELLRAALADYLDKFHTDDKE